MLINSIIAHILRMALYWLGIGRQITLVSASTISAMRRLTRRGIAAQTVIDIGASDGHWTAQIMRFFPGAHYLLIEAQAIHEDQLKRFCKRHPNTNYVLKAAGERIGKIFFDSNDPFGGQASTSEDAARQMEEVPMTTIDAEVMAKNLPGPYLIKFDVHGFELPILEGAKETLKNTSLIVMECYNFQISDTSLLFHEMCQHLAGLGFRVIDISEPLWRKRDHAFWQADIFFVRSDRPEFQISTYD